MRALAVASLLLAVGSVPTATACVATPDGSTDVCESYGTFSITHRNPVAGNATVCAGPYVGLFFFVPSWAGAEYCLEHEHAATGSTTACGWTDVFWLFAAGAFQAACVGHDGALGDHAAGGLVGGVVYYLYPNVGLYAEGEAASGGSAQGVSVFAGAGLVHVVAASACAEGALSRCAVLP